MSVLLSSPLLGTTAHASSTLNNNSKLYGASNALDNQNESSCWNSDGRAEGDTEHSFTVNFHRNVRIYSIGLQFQGGFVAEECRLFTTKKKATLDSSSEGWVEIKDAYIEPENANTLQVFSLEDCGSGDDFNCVALKLVFNSTTDFYGRIILYKIEVYGEEIP